VHVVVTDENTTGTAVERAYCGIIRKDVVSMHLNDCGIPLHERKVVRFARISAGARSAYELNFHKTDNVV
jgi:hypothetical protein